MFLSGEIVSVWQGRSRRKISGGIVHLNRKKRRFEIADDPIRPVIGAKPKRLYRRGLGGRIKSKLIAETNINVIDSKTKKAKKAKLITVKDNNANPHYVQRNILNKGVIVLTDIGMIKITSRPGQDGNLNGILIEDKTVDKKS
jgi:small subunit ribosomal protein S8e